MDKTVQVYCDRHANLDSFPLRYGFSFSKDAFLNISFKDQTRKADKKKKGRYSVQAEFINPESKKIEKGIFYLFNRFKENAADEVVTVIRVLNGNAESEHHLSSVLRSFREAGVITTKELIQMHPLYISGKIKKHVDIYEYLFEKRSASDIKKFQKIISEVEQDIKKQDALINSLEVQIQDKDEQIEELKQKIKLANEEREKKDLHVLRKDYPSIDWHDGTVTSAAFNYWEVRGDFLCIFLLGIKKPIKLKNTFIYDYPVALEAVKKLLYGELFEYETKGSNIFSPGEWFSKIVSSDGYSTFAGIPMSEMYPDDPIPEMPENLKQMDTIEIATDEVGIFLDKPPEGRSRDEDVLEREIWLSAYSISGLKEQTYTSDTTFKVIYCYKQSGSYFQMTFNHTWRQDMLILYTDKGWFIDTTVLEHGGTEWKEGVTYHNCKVSLTKGKDLPYWLQK